MTFNPDFKRRGPIAISLWQPWAALVVLGHKRIETRHWENQYRGPVIIHAAKRWTRDQAALLRQDPFRKLVGRAPLAFMAYIGTVNLVDILKIDQSTLCAISEQEAAFGNFTPGRFAWILENPQAAVAPIAAAGHQGIWTPAPGVFAQLTGQAA